MRRAPGPPDESFRRSASNYPFWPGGFDLPNIEIDGSIDDLDFSPEKLLICPRVNFYKANLAEQKSEEGRHNELDVTQSQFLSSELPAASTALNLASGLNQTDDVLALFTESEKAPVYNEVKTFILSEIDDFLIDETGRLVSISDGAKHLILRMTQWDGWYQSQVERVVSISDGANHLTLRMTQWAEMLNSEAPLSDFHKKVPQMAYQWPFKLDTFFETRSIKFGAS